MYHIIGRKEDCDIDCIKVKKPYVTSSNIHVFDISYNKKPLLVQTPVGTIPYSYNIFDNTAFKIDVVFTNNLIYELTNLVHDTILQKINKYNPEMLHKKVCIDYINQVNQVKQGEDSPLEIKVRLKSPRIDNIGAFDLNRNAIKVSSLQTFDRVICMFQIQRLIVLKDTYFFQAQLVQVQRLNVNISPLICIINDEFSHIDFTKYSKMVSLGISIEAVQHKMVLDGLGENAQIHWKSNLLARKTNISKSAGSIQPCALPCGTPPPPPPPPPPLRLSGTSHLQQPMKKPAFLTDILSSNFELKKTSIHMPVTKSSIKMGYNAPTLTDILTAKSRLRKAT
jgi:hypothetical protein